jgi:hypothetical protein
MSPEKQELLKKLEERGLDKNKFKRLSVSKLKAKIAELDKADEVVEEPKDEVVEEPELDQEQLSEMKEAIVEACEEVKKNALIKRHMASARFATLLGLTLKSPRPVCSHAMQMHFNSIMPRPNANNFNKDIHNLYQDFKKYISLLK